jgi:hypothetical protein
MTYAPTTNYYKASVRIVIQNSNLFCSNNRFIILVMVLESLYTNIKGILIAISYA